MLGNSLYELYSRLEHYEIATSHLIKILSLFVIISDKLDNKYSWN